MGTSGSGRWLPVALVGLAVVAALGVGAFAVVQLLPDDDDSSSVSSSEPEDSDADDPGREPQVSPTTTTEPGPVADDLLGGDFPAAYASLIAAAGNPTQILEVEIHDTYAFLSYRDPVDPSHLDQRQWRNGEVGDAGANVGADRVDATTEPKLLAPTDFDPTLIAQLVADAPLHYDIPTQVTHVIIDRFLPFDERVLLRVYATPTDGRSGGGYVSYDTAGALVDTCC